MNLPNALSAGRIAITPLIAVLPLASSSTLRLIAFVLFVVAGVSDYADGVLARSRKQETNLGKMLDPLADKLLLVGTVVPMYMLSGAGPLAGPMRAHPEVYGVMTRTNGVLPGALAFPFATPVGAVPLFWWIVLIVVGRELAMTIFRQAAARRGLVIAAIGPAKWKTGMQLVWQGAAYFWFFIATMAVERRWTSGAWHAMALFNGAVGTLTMTTAVVLTVYSLWLYVSRYGSVFGERARGGQRG
jgi:phosphatidylglycerophosphate synthase